MNGRPSGAGGGWVYSGFAEDTQTERVLGELEGNFRRLVTPGQQHEFQLGDLVAYARDGMGGWPPRVKSHRTRLYDLLMRITELVLSTPRLLSGDTDTVDRLLGIRSLLYPHCVDVLGDLVGRGPDQRLEQDGEEYDPKARLPEDVLEENICLYLLVQKIEVVACLQRQQYTLDDAHGTGRMTAHDWAQLLPGGACGQLDVRVPEDVAAAMEGPGRRAAAARAVAVVPRRPGGAPDTGGAQDPFAGVYVQYMDAAWRDAMCLLGRIQRVREYHPALTKYIDMLRVQLSMLFVYGEPAYARSRPSGGGGGPLQVYASMTLRERVRSVFGGLARVPAHMGDRDWLVDSKFFFKMDGACRVANRRYIREHMMVFGHLEWLTRHHRRARFLPTLTPDGAGAMPAPGVYEWTVSPLWHAGGRPELPEEFWPTPMDMIILWRDCINVTISALANSVRHECQKRLFSCALMPCERERFMREASFEDPIAYNVLARYRPGELDRLADFLEKCKNPPEAFFKWRLNALIEHESKRSPGIARAAGIRQGASLLGDDGYPVPHEPLHVFGNRNFENMMYEVVLKYMFDSMFHVNSLLPFMIERHRRPVDGSSPPQGTLWMVQWMYAYELCTDRASFRLPEHLVRRYGEMPVVFVSWLKAMPFRAPCPGSPTGYIDLTVLKRSYARTVNGVDITRAADLVDGASSSTSAAAGAIVPVAAAVSSDAAAAAAAGADVKHVIMF